MSVLIITFESSDSASTYVKETGITWPVMIDEGKTLYQRYEMRKAGFWDLWGPATWWAYLKQIMRGNLPRKSAGDIQQRGGNVLIDPGGSIRYQHVGSGPADRPSVESLIRVIRKAQKQRGEEAET